MLSLINEHEGFLSVLIEDDSLSSNKMFLESQKKLENDFKNYLIHYKFIKKHIFKVIENVMRKKKQKKLIWKYCFSQYISVCDFGKNRMENSAQYIVYSKL